MDKSCPYCQSRLGYYQVEQVKRQARYSWDGRFIDHTVENVFYQGKTMRCLDCDEKVTSFAIGVQREMDNG